MPRLIGPMNPHRNSRRRRVRSQYARLDDLEAAIMPEPEPEHPLQDLWALLRWATTAGGYAATLAATAADTLAELAELDDDALDAGEITPGDYFPALATGRRHLSPERQARQDAANRTLGETLSELAALRRATAHAQQVDRP
jgi:hypothetical protein